MKQFYKIKEISTLYNICTDSLRYYEEKGVLSPIRGENGYRLYGINDIWKLNIIKDLRSLNFSTKQIKSYFDNRSTSTTLELLKEEDEIIAQRILELSNMRKSIAQRYNNIKNSKSLDVGKIYKENIPPRRCTLIKKDNITEQEIDLLANTINMEVGETLYLLGSNKTGAFISKEYLEKGMYTNFTAVFIIDEKMGNYSIKGGEYLSIRYHGEYTKAIEYYQKLKEYADKNGYQIKGDPLELYLIDIHETNITEEFLTELQIRVEKQ